MTIPGGYIAGDVLTAANMNLLPGGLEGGGTASAVTNQTSISTEADLTSLTVTWTAVTGRSYLVTVRAIAQQISSAGDQQIKITNSSNTQIARSLATVAASSYYTHTVQAIVSGVSGSVTYKARGTTSAGTMTIVAASDSPALITVVDIGPT